MDADRFDTLARSLKETQSRRGLTQLLGGLALGAPLALRGLAETEAKRKKKKKKKKKASGGTPVCTPQCAGCGGSNGCGGTCGCGANQFCDTGICRTCDVTCNGDPIACGSALNQRLTDGGTIYVCPGRYRGNFTMGTAKLIGAGKGDNPATSTILDAAGSGRVVTISANATAELVGLRITGGKVSGNVGGGVRADAGDLRITNCTITGNEAANGGGGIYSAGAFRLTNSTVSQNTGSIGGGLQLNGTQPGFLTDSVIAGNQTGSGNNFGGGFYNFSSSTLTIVGTEISGNNAGQGGGGIQNYNGTITFNATSRVTNNTATTAGGIANQAGTVNLNGATVSGNSNPQCSNVSGC